MTNVWNRLGFFGDGLHRLASHLSVDLLRHWVRSPHFSVASYELALGLELSGVKPSVVIDVGANVGQFGIAVSGRLRPSRVICFEPNPEAAAQLRQNVLTKPEISVRAIGIGAKPGILSLRVNSHSHSSSFLPLTDEHRTAFPFATEMERVEVKVSTLDLEFPTLSELSMALLKIDVQGFEREVLAGAEKVLSAVRWVVMEVSFDPLYEGEWIFDEAQRFMDTRGFRFVRPVAFLTDGRHGRIVQMDALFMADRLPHAG